MTTKVVHCKKEPYDVYIGRGQGGSLGGWGNPVAIGKVCPHCGNVHNSRGDTLPCYKILLDYKLTQDISLRGKIKELAGSILGCWCKPDNPCHGDILAEYAEKFVLEDQSPGDNLDTLIPRYDGGQE